MPAAFLPAALVFLWIGVISFGGGPAIVPEIYRQLVVLHAWITPQQFADGYAIGQLAPGPNMLAIVFFGYEVAGPAGGLFAPVAVVGPGAVLSAACGRAWATMGQGGPIDWVRRGLVPVAFGLIAGGALVLGRATIHGAPGLVLAALVALVVQRRWVHTAVAVLAAGAAGVALGL